MDLKGYARVLRAHWALIVGAVVLCTAGAAALAWTREPVYEAHTQMFVSVATAPSNQSPSENYQGGLFSQGRVKSYATVVSSPSLAQAVAAQLGRSRSAKQVQSEITASVVEGTVLIDVTVRDASPRLAKAIADALGELFPQFVNKLESSQPSRSSPVKVTVTSPAELPTSAVSPDKRLSLILGVLLGLIVGVVAAVLREVLDRRIRDEDHASAIAGAPILGRIAHDPDASRRPLVVVAVPDSAAAETYRRLRTNLTVSTVDLGLRSIVVSSAVPAEGKTLVVANLGLAFAQAGADVVLVDADMRQSRLAQVLGIEATEGLSDVVAGDVALETALHRHHELPLEVLASGSAPPDPSALLGSQRCAAVLDALTRRARVVICDTPALLAVGDAAVLARLASAVVLVARVGTTRADRFDVAADSLRAVGKQPLGIVLNGLQARADWPYGNGARIGGGEPLYEGAVWDR
jgi:capsular exopolysaccharide synthesis family protein